MLRIFAKSWIKENRLLYPLCTGKNAIQYWFITDEEADIYMETYFDKQTRDGFITTFQQGTCKDKLITSMFIDKPKLQTTLETASPEEIQAIEEKNNAEELAIAVKRNSIDLIKEMEIWLGTIDSYESRRAYLSRIKNHFLKYCKEKDFNPVMFLPKEAREFENWLIDKKKSNHLIRSIIFACKKLFTCLWENHGIPIHTNPFGSKSLLPPKERVKELIIPDEEDKDRILDDTHQKYPIVHTFIKLSVKHGMRVGAFQWMKIRGNKAVTKSKGKKHSYNLDDEDITLLKAHLLNEFIAKQLGDMVNYYLKRAYERGVTKAIYSAHDFRHYFSIDFYKKNKDTLSYDSILYELSKKLGHSSIHATKVYLESLNKESL